MRLATLALCLIAAAALALSAAAVAPRAGAQGASGVIQLIPMTSPQLQASPGGCVDLTQVPGGGWPQANITSQLGYGYLAQPDLWNMKSGSGYDEVRACSDGYFAYVSFTNATASNPEDTVMGYPELIYGYKPFSEAASGESPLLELPQPMGSLPQIYVYLNYTVNYTDGRGDFSFDIWVTRAYMPTTVTSSDLEIMIWLYHSPGFLPLGPSAPPTANFTIPTVINGTPVNATWSVYAATGWPWTYMAFVLSPPLRSGTIVVPVSAIFEYASQVWQRFSSTPLSQMYLNDLELGMEFTSLQWPPVEVNVSAWYAIHAYDILVYPRPAAATTVTLPTTATLTTYLPSTATVTSTAPATTVTVTTTAIVTRAVTPAWAWAAVTVLALAAVILGALLALRAR